MLNSYTHSLTLTTRQYICSISRHVGQGIEVIYLLILLYGPGAYDGHMTNSTMALSLFLHVFRVLSVTIIQVCRLLSSRQGIPWHDCKSHCSAVSSRMGSSIYDVHAEGGRGRFKVDGGEGLGSVWTSTLKSQQTYK